MVTTIQLPEELRDRIKALKQPHETYADVIEAALSYLEEEDELELSDAALRDIAEAEEDLKAGRVYTMDQVRKELGL